MVVALLCSDSAWYRTPEMLIKELRSERPIYVALPTLAAAKTQISLSQNRSRIDCRLTNRFEFSLRLRKLQSIRLQAERKFNLSSLLIPSPSPYILKCKLACLTTLLICTFTPCKRIPNASVKGFERTQTPCRCIHFCTRQEFVRETPP